VYGAHGYYVERPEDIADTVREALTLNGPSVIEIPVAEYFPTAAPAPEVGGDINGRNFSCPPSSSPISSLDTVRYGARLRRMCTPPAVTRAGIGPFPPCGGRSGWRGEVPWFHPHPRPPPSRGRGNSVEAEAEEWHPKGGVAHR
jgi:hypothetical protein